MAKNYSKLTSEERTALLEQAKTTGWYLKVERMSAGLKLGWMAGQLGISAGMLSGLESGTRVWTPERIKAFKAVIRANQTERTNNHARKKSRPARDGRGRRSTPKNQSGR